MDLIFANPSSVSSDGKLPDAATDLHNHVFTGGQKRWVVDQIFRGQVTAAELERKYQVSRKTFTSWVRRFREGRLLKTGRGRLPNLDDQSLEDGKNRLFEMGISEGLAKQDIRNVVKDEYRLTFKRHNPSYLEDILGSDETPKMKSRTARKYRKFFEEVVNNILPELGELSEF